MAGASSRELSRHLSTLFHCGATSQISDSELLERFVAGHDEVAEAAFAALVERHGVMVLGVCRRVLGNRDEAEDSFQATFLVLAKKAATIARPEQLASWLHGVARHAALDARTRATRQKAREKRLGAMRPRETTDQTMATELHTVLDEELARLPERHRSAIVLCELEGLSRRQAASRLGVSEGTLSSRLARAKSRLRDRLTRRGFALSAAALTSILVQDAQAVVLPPLLVDSTIRVATLVAAGSSLAAVVSTSVVTLTEGVLKTMFLAKIKYALLGLVTLAVVSTSVGVQAQFAGDQASDNDRLKSVERKLDRLLEVLGGTGSRTRAADGPGMSALPAPSPDARPTDDPTPALPPMPSVPPAPAVARSADVIAMQPGSPGAPGRQKPAQATRPADAPTGGVPIPTAIPLPPHPPAPLTAAASDGGNLAPIARDGRNDLARRVETLEQRLGEIERRFGELERRMDKVAHEVSASSVPPIPQSSDRLTLPEPDDARPLSEPTREVPTAPAAPDAPFPGPAPSPE